METIDVLMPIYDRPEFQQVTFEYINAARKPRKYKFWGFLDGGYSPKNKVMFEEMFLGNREVILRPSKFGINTNTPAALAWLGAKTKGEYVIQIQGDNVISPDFFEFVDYTFRTFSPDIVCGDGVPSLPGIEELDKYKYVRENKDFYTATGGCIKTTTLNKFIAPHFNQSYFNNHDAYAKEHFPGSLSSGSDFMIVAICRKHNLEVIRPLSTRCMHTGFHGCHCPMDKQFLDQWGGMSYKERVVRIRKIVTDKSNPFTYNQGNNIVTRFINQDNNWDRLELLGNK